jgi:tetratricopeptide (TPR) repeat protein
MNQNLPHDTLIRRSLGMGLLRMMSRLRQRPWFWFIPAAPPFLLFCALLATGIAESARTEEYQNRYLGALDRAYEKSDFTSANIYFTKLREIGYNANSNARFIGAVLDIRAGRTEAGHKALDEIAPANHTGFRPAHLWRAQQILSKELSEADQNEVRHHLQSALGEEADEVWIRTSLAKICIKQKDYRTALGQLIQVVERQPELNILLGEVHEKLDNKDSFTAAMRNAVEHFLTQLQRDPNNTNTRVTLAMIYYKLNDLELALQTIADGLELENPDPALRGHLSKLLVARFDQVTQQQAEGSGGVVTQLSLLQQAIEMNSANPMVVMRLRSLMENNDAEARIAATEILNRMLAAGQSAGTVHFILGTHAVNSGDTQSAKLHFERSYEEFGSQGDHPEVPSLLNNLAWIMMQEDKDLNNAVELVSQGISLLEDEDRRLAMMRETRGQLLMRTGEWKLAISDLEFVLPRLQTGQTEIHKLLAEAYRNLGQTAIAAEHERMASEN